MLNNFMQNRRNEKELKDSGRLPPGQSLTTRFPVLHYGPVPVYKSLENWDFKVSGLVEEEVSWTWDEFTQLPTRNVVYDLHCVTTWSKFDTPWEGVHLKDMLESGLIKLKPEAKYCVQHCEYGFTVNLPIDVMLADNFLLAYRYEGQPLDPEHGYPLRGLMGAVAGEKADADRYLWKGGKWLRGLEFVAKDQPGFWEKAGYSMTANIWREERLRRDF